MTTSLSNRYRALRSAGSTLAEIASRHSRDHKLQLIRSLLPPPPASILAIGVEGDGPGFVGGSPTGNQIERGLLDAGYRITALSFDGFVPQSLVKAGAIYLRGDGLTLPFRDDSFDIVFSNAVVEHVGGLQAAIQYVNESRRVGRVLALHTTPNRWFPIETHTKVPLVHWLPRRWHPLLLGWRSTYQWRNTDYLLSRREFHRLSPEGTAQGVWPVCWPMTLVAMWPAQ